MHTKAFAVAKKLHWAARCQVVDAGHRLARIGRTVRLRLPARTVRHALPGQLIVSLTSYPPRFPTLYPTLVSLLTQRTKAERVVLWIAADDMKQLPAKVVGLQSRGLDIRATTDTGPYKKIIPALTAFPGAFIATADDDIDYDRNWLRDLVAGWTGETKRIVFHRGHDIRLNADGRPDHYADWQFCIEGPRLSPTIFPTGAGGVLYPPGSLSPEVVDEGAFMALCPRADDIWLYFMGRRAGSTYYKTPGRSEVVHGLNSQHVALYYDNIAGGANDAVIAAMIARFGWPESG